MRRRFSFKRYGSDSHDFGIIIGKKPENIYYQDNSKRAYKQILPNKKLDAFFALSGTYFAMATYKNKKLKFFATTNKDIISLFRVVFDELWK